MERFQGKVAIVTGGAQGIGEAIARRLAAEGGTVAILDIQQEKAKAVASDIADKGGKAIAVKMDITNSQEVKLAVKEVESKFGKVDILINNVGWDKLSLFIEAPEELWDKIIAVNLRGTMTVTRAVLDGMVNRRYGKIVTIASDAGRVGTAGEPIYSACKGGLIAFTKALTRELSRYNIVLNCICPGPVDTALWADLSKSNPRLPEALVRMTPMRRIGKPEDMAPVVAFLASDEAGFVTGQSLSVNGGLNMI